MIPWNIILRAAGVATVALIVLALFGFAVHSCSAPARHDAAQAQVNAAQNQGHAQAASDAVGVVDNHAANDAAVDAQTRENHANIVAAPGAAAPVDSGVNDAGLRALCLRRAYRASQQCVDLLNPHPAVVAPAGSGG